MSRPVFIVCVILIAILLFAILVAFLRQATRRRYLMLATFAGLTSFEFQQHRRVAAAPPLPDYYSLGMNLEDFDILFHSASWNTETGATKAAVALFVENPAHCKFS